MGSFFSIVTRHPKKGVIEIHPEFNVAVSDDIMIRAKSFYAVWDRDTGLWSTDEYDVQRIVDKAIAEYYGELEKIPGIEYNISWMKNYSSNSWHNYCKFVKEAPESYKLLDNKLIFSNAETKREDYASKKLPYPLQEGPCPAYEELTKTLYDKDELRKIEWGIGSIIAGDSKYIQKFIVLYGSAGSGKSTILNIIQKLFEGYYTTFEAKALATSSNSFSTEVFKSNPLVAIQHDGDLSKIEDNTKLNSIVSHEEMTLNEKYKPSYTSRINCFLFMGTNKPVKITDAKSGIIRRLIDVQPSGRLLEPHRYQILMNQINFELGAIAKHCLNVYKRLGKDYYNGYRPFEMMYKTDVFYNFVEDSYFVFKKQDGCSLKQAWDLYKEYCNDSFVDFKLPKYKFREELKNYFKDFYPMTRINDDVKEGHQVRNYYSGFIYEKFGLLGPRGKISFEDESHSDSDNPIQLVLDSDKSIFDEVCAECPAQYASKNETPLKKWASVTTKLKDLDTTKLHYVKVPENHIVIDFDLKDETGEKSAEKNLEEASKWPETYAEYSKGGAGIHLHYIYDGDPEKLSRIYSEGIEIKVFNGNSSLRRRLSKCNNVPIAHISSGLPLKGAKVINFDAVKSEKSLRNLVERNLRKEIHPGTKPSVDFIHKILEDAYNSGLKYDLTDMRPAVLAFANNSSHQAEYCLKLVSQMKFKSEDQSDGSDDYDDERIVFFDVEVFPNLFLINWKYEGKDSTCVRMINPTPTQVEDLMKRKLVGFNCRRYDNHILYARYLGYNNLELYNLSQRIIGNSRNGTFSEAYNISYADVYDFSSKKQSLKKFEIELGIHHQELGLPWDQPVPEDLWPKVAEYCDNDVIATEAVFNARHADFVAREILAKLAGMPVNTPTNTLTAKIIFGNDRTPKLVYTDLATGRQW